MSAALALVPALAPTLGPLPDPALTAATCRLLTLADLARTDPWQVHRLTVDGVDTGVGGLELAADRLFEGHRVSRVIVVASPVFVWRLRGGPPIPGVGPSFPARPGWAPCSLGAWWVSPQVTVLVTSGTVWRTPQSV